MSDKMDQIYDLLEKVYIELQETKTGLNKTTNELHDAKDSFENGIKKIDIKMENDITPRIEALFDAQALATEQLVKISKKQEEHDHRFDIVETKVEAMANKMIRHSYDIGTLKRREAREA